MAAIDPEVVDTGEKRDLRGRRVVPPQRRRELIEAYRASGITLAEFARREAINYSTMAGWVARSAKLPVKNPIQFAQVHVPTRRSATGSLLEVRLADGTMVRGERVADLALLVRALRG